MRGDRAFVDDIFLFDQPIGVDYSGGWHDASTFAIDLVDTAGSLASPAVARISLRQDGADSDADGAQAT